MKNVTEQITQKNRWGLKEQLFLLVLVSALAVFVGQSFEDNLRHILPEQRVFRSVVNKKESGLSALFTIAKQSDLPCQVWVLPYRRLGEAKGLLFVSQPHIAWKETEVKDILSWVWQGNQLVYLDYFSRNEPIFAKEKGWKVEKKFTEQPLLAKLGLSPAWLKNGAVMFDHRLPEMTHVHKLLLKSEVKLNGGRPLVGCKGGGAYITAVKYGSGRVLVGTVPAMCSNVKLNEANNYDKFQFMINCFRTAGGAILFDEYCHGITGTSNIFVYFSRRLPGLITCQLLLMLILATLGTRQRFGSPKELQSDRQISDFAYVSGLGNVYKHAQANLAALEIIVGFWKTKLCRQFGLPARASIEEISQRAKDSNLITREQKNNGQVALNKLAQFLNDYEQAVSQGEISKAQLMHLVSQCDSLSRYMR